MVSLLATVFHGELARRFVLSFVFSVGFARLFWARFFKRHSKLRINVIESYINVYNFFEKQVQYSKVTIA